jgi:hypothetical protein
VEKSPLAKLAVNVDVFIARLETQKSLNAPDVIRNLIKTLMQLEISTAKHESNL